jgi:hypothetical protein
VALTRLGDQVAVLIHVELALEQRCRGVDLSSGAAGVGYEVSSSLFYVYSSCTFATSLQGVTWMGYDDRPKRRRGCS